MPQVQHLYLRHVCRDHFFHLFHHKNFCPALCLDVIGILKGKGPVSQAFHEFYRPRIVTYPVGGNVFSILIHIEKEIFGIP